VAEVLIRKGWQNYGQLAQSTNCVIKIPLIRRGIRKSHLLLEVVVVLLVNIFFYDAEFLPLNQPG